MKKHILIFLLFTGFLQAQTYPVNPTKFGKISLNTNVEDNTAGKISVQSATNEINWLLPENIPINQPPHPINYTVTAPTLGSHLIGIDTKFGTFVQTTAGITNRIYFTGDQTTITAGTFYTSSVTGKGSVPSVSQTTNNDDNAKSYFTTDFVSIAQPATTIAPAGNFSGSLSVMVNNDGAQERYTIEVYKTNNGGTPIASGITGAPTGSLGVTVVAILDSGILDLTQNAVTNINVSGLLASQLTLNTGERLRYHISAEKVGTAGGVLTYTLFFGSNYNSYYDVPVVNTTDTTINKSAVAGTTSTDALNTLNTLKANLASPTFTGTVTVPTPALGTDAVNKTYADGLIVGLLNDRGSYNASSNLFPSTGGSGTGGAIMKGDIWYLTAGGTLSSKIVRIDDSVRALTDSPGQTGANWSLLASPTQYTVANDLNVIHTTGNESKSGVLTLSTGALLSAETASTIASFDATKNLKSLSTATYPSLTELSYVKGVTSAIQTQLNSKQATLTNPLTGSGTAGYLPKYTGSTTVGNSIIYDNGSMVGVGTTAPTGKFQVRTGTDENLGFLSGAGRTVISAFNDAVSANVGISLDASDFEWKTSGVSRSTLSASGVLKINGLSGTGTRQIVADASGNLSATTAVVPYTKYVATLTQTGTGDPTVSVLENTLGTTVTWTRTGTGFYRGTLSSPLLTAGKRFVLVSPRTGGNIYYDFLSTSVVQIVTTSYVNVGTDALLNETSFEIRVYP